MGEKIVAGNVCRTNSELISNNENITRDLRFGDNTDEKARGFEREETCKGYLPRRTKDVVQEGGTTPRRRGITQPTKRISACGGLSVKRIDSSVTGGALTGATLRQERDYGTRVERIMGGAKRGTRFNTYP